MNTEIVKKASIVIAAGFAVIFCLSPFVYMIFTAVSRSPDFFLPGQTVGLTFAHFFAVATSQSLHFFAYLRNSLIISIASAGISVFCASLAAYAVTSRR